MKWYRKLRIWLSLHIQDYDPQVDARLEWMMMGTTLVHDLCDNYCLVLKNIRGGQLYAVWAENRWYGDLTHCYKLDPDCECLSERTYLWLHSRPSRKMKIKFWEWVEEQLGGMTYEDFLCERIRNGVLGGVR